jgi:hypothetical protein
VNYLAKFLATIFFVILFDGYAIYFNFKSFALFTRYLSF